MAAMSSVAYACGRGTSLVMLRETMSVLSHVEVVDKGTTMEQAEEGGSREVRC